MESNIKAFNITFNCLNKNTLFSLLEDKKSTKLLATVNAEFVVLANENPKFKAVLDNAITTIDGQIPYFFLKLRNRKIHIEKLSGSDLIYDICSKAQQLKLKVFLLGGSELSNQLALERLKTLYPKLKIQGFAPPFSPYPFPPNTNNCIYQKLEKFKPDILFVAFGAPKQEFWIYDNLAVLNNIGTRLAIGVGGTFEFVAGIEKRAPKFIQKLGLESVWRLMQNPKRYKRFIKNFIFFKYAFI